MSLNCSCRAKIGNRDLRVPAPPHQGPSTPPPELSAAERSPEPLPTSAAARAAPRVRVGCVGCMRAVASTAAPLRRWPVAWPGWPRAWEGCAARMHASSRKVQLHVAPLGGTKTSGLFAKGSHVYQSTEKQEAPFEKAWLRPPPDVPRPRTPRRGAGGGRQASVRSGRHRSRAARAHAGA